MIDSKTFEKHKATFATWKTPNGWDLEWLRWKDPETSIYGVYYLVQGPFLYVSGDIGEAVFQWNQCVSLAYIADCNLDYILGKCRASEVGYPFVEWDGKVAKERMESYFADLKKDAGDEEEDKEAAARCEQKFAECDGWYALENKFEWECWAGENASSIFGNDWCEGVTGCPGTTTHPRAELMFEGLKAAMAQLKEKKEEGEKKECPNPPPSSP